MPNLFNILRTVLGVEQKKHTKRKKTHKKRGRRIRQVPIPPSARVHARALVLSRLEYFNQFYGYRYNKVFIKNTRTRWGSCSSQGNLNFSYRIIDLDPEVQDYIVVHELCHLQEFNHAPVFWDLVARTVPDYATLRAQLKQVPLS